MTSMELASAKYFNSEASAAESPVKVEAKSWTTSLISIGLLSIGFGLWGMVISAYQINGIQR